MSKYVPRESSIDWSKKKKKVGEKQSESAKI